MDSQLKIIKRLTSKQREIVKILADDYEFITKMDAIKYIKSRYGDYFAVSDIIRAYKAIDKFND